MKVNELIKHLRDLEDLHGDVEVGYDYDDGYSICGINEIAFNIPRGKIVLSYSFDWGGNV
jgi:hypothetical protein